MTGVGPKTRFRVVIQVLTRILGRLQQLGEPKMPVMFRRWITREMLQGEREKLFVFGDNLARVGLGGQAKEMRGEPNAVGLPTKRSPWVYLEDDDCFEVERACGAEWARLMNHVTAGGTIVWPADGIGTGLAKLREKAPRIADMYDTFLEALRVGDP